MSLEPALIVIHGTLLVAVQLQLLAAVTITLPMPPAVTTLADVGDTDDGQEPDACVTVNVLPPTLIEPVRELLPVFVVTL